MSPRTLARAFAFAATASIALLGLTACTPAVTMEPAKDAVATACAQRLSLVRASATASPPMAPPTKAMRLSARVQRAESTMNQKSGRLKVRMSKASISGGRGR